MNLKLRVFHSFLFRVSSLNPLASLEASLVRLLKGTSPSTSSNGLLYILLHEDLPCFLLVLIYDYSFYFTPHH